MYMRSRPSACAANTGLAPRSFRSGSPFQCRGIPQSPRGAISQRRGLRAGINLIKMTGKNPENRIPRGFFSETTPFHRFKTEGLTTCIILTMTGLASKAQTGKSAACLRQGQRPFPRKRNAKLCKSPTGDRFTNLAGQRIMLSARQLKPIEYARKRICGVLI